MTDVARSQQSVRERLLRLLGAESLIDACEFYAEDAGNNLRGTAGRWAPGVHPAPQPKLDAHGKPSMWDNGSIARWALASALGRRQQP